LPVATRADVDITKLTAREERVTTFGVSTADPKSMSAKVLPTDPKWLGKVMLPRLLALIYKKWLMDDDVVSLVH